MNKVDDQTEQYQTGNKKTCLSCNEIYFPVLIAQSWLVRAVPKAEFQNIFNSAIITGMSYISSQVTSLNGTTPILKRKFWYVYLTINLEASKCHSS